jgi:hypothetical protein
MAVDENLDWVPRVGYENSEDKESPKFKGHFTDVITFFRDILARREIILVLAKLAFNVLKIYDTTPMLRLGS